jgi:hypothetical protein
MFSIIRGTVGVLYYKIGTIHSALFFFFFIIEKTYVALQKVLWINEIKNIHCNNNNWKKKKEKS